MLRFVTVACLVLAAAAATTASIAVSPRHPTVPQTSSNRDPDAAPIGVKQPHEIDAAGSSLATMY